MELTIIIPAYNEAGNLEQVLIPLKQFAIENNFKIIVVNDGSIDNSKELINQFIDDYNFRVIHHKINCGYGAAIKSGIREANTPYVVTIDADGQHSIDDIIRLYKEIKESDADLIVGSRYRQKSSTISRGIGKSIIRLFVRILVKVPVYDINSGMKIYKTALAKKYIRLAPDTMAFSDVMTIVFVYFKGFVKEVPITINQRVNGKSTINYKTGLTTLKEILFVATTFAPYKFFTILASIILFITLCWGIPFVYIGKGVTAGTASGILVSVLLWCLGVIAQLISGIRKDLIENSG
jgi:glycosyltransferase involved in cell wall biosynthesis